MGDHVLLSLQVCEALMTKWQELVSVPTDTCNHWNDCKQELASHIDTLATSAAPAVAMLCDVLRLSHTAVDQAQQHIVQREQQIVALQAKIQVHLHRIDELYLCLEERDLFATENAHIVIEMQSRLDELDMIRAEVCAVAHSGGGILACRNDHLTFWLVLRHS